MDWAAEVTDALGAPTTRRLQRALEGKAGLSPGELARLAEGLSVASQEANDKAKATVELDQGKAIDAGVVFTLREAYSRESLDTKAVKLLLPRNENPDIYRDHGDSRGNIGAGRAAAQGIEHTKAERRGKG